jgi:diaminopropionate ammonia-lyase
MRLLAGDGVVAGETGAAGLAGMIRLAEDSDPLFGADACVLLLGTEGATDPQNYARIVGGAG